jgi:lipopolysaccharide biosynthesis protein
MKIAVCVHLYHIDMWDKIKKYLDNLNRDYSLFVSLPVKDERNIPYDFDWEFYVSYYQDLKNANKNTYEKAINHYLKHGEKEGRVYSKGNLEIISKLKKYKSDVNILLSPNKGVDIGGFLYTYKKVPKDIDLILKIHTKAGLGSNEKPSTHLKKHGLENSIKRGEVWFRNLLSGVLGDKERVNRIIESFINNPKCGMVGFKKYNSFQLNKKEMNRVFDLLLLDVDYTNHFFIGGTIFWVDNSILKKYLTNSVIDEILNKSSFGYTYEPSINHAMERVFGCLVYNENKEIYVIK